MCRFHGSKGCALQGLDASEAEGSAPPAISHAGRPDVRVRSDGLPPAAVARAFRPAPDAQRADALSCMVHRPQGPLAPLRPVLFVSAVRPVAEACGALTHFPLHPQMDDFFLSTACTSCPLKPDGTVSESYQASVADMRSQVGGLRGLGVRFGADGVRGSFAGKTGVEAAARGRVADTLDPGRGGPNGASPPQWNPQLHFQDLTVALALPCLAPPTPRNKRLCPDRLPGGHCEVVAQHAARH
jgi:hypothetical protein